MVITTAHLSLSCGWVYLRRLDGAEILDDDVKLYRFADGPDWDYAFGHEPSWLESEHEEIADICRDRREFALGCERTAEASYLMAKGR